MKTAILVYSVHHGNTRKLVDAIAEKHEVDIIDVKNTDVTDLSSYDRLGLASGIYASNFGRPLFQYAKENLPEGKPVFFLYTSASGEKAKFPKQMRLLAEEKHCEILGEYRCFGFNTFGPFKLFGGTAKGHPTPEELDGAVAFYEDLEPESK